MSVAYVTRLDSNNESILFNVPLTFAIVPDPKPQLSITPHMLAVVSEVFNPYPPFLIKLQFRKVAFEILDVALVNLIPSVPLLYESQLKKVKPDIPIRIEKPCLPLLSEIHLINVTADAFVTVVNPSLLLPVLSWEIQLIKVV